jgi:hypothetical protein
MKRPATRTMKRRDIEPEFQRLSRVNDLGRMWNYILPKSVPFDMLPLYKRTLDPQIIEQESRAALEKLCKFKGTKAVVGIPPHLERKNVKGFVVYTLSLCDRALESLSDSQARLQSEATARAQKATSNAQDILRELEVMREAQDAPDFKRSPTDDAYKAAHESLKAAYTHYVGSAPAPDLAPDGDGGVVVQWKSGKREVRLVVPPVGAEKSYIYSRGTKTAKVDYDISGSILAQQLRSTFSD